MVNFSCTGKLLLTVGLDDEHSVAVWRWQEGEHFTFGKGLVESYSNLIYTDPRKIFLISHMFL